MATIRAEVPKEELPVNLNNKKAPLFWGMIGIIAIETTVFASLIAGYFYLRYYVDNWPLGDIERPELLLPVIGLIILLSSAAPIYVADRSIKEGNQTRMLWGLAGSFILGLAFLVLKFIEYSSLEYDWTTNAYGSIQWTIVGFHSAHVIALLLKTAVVFTWGVSGHFTKDRSLGVTVNSLYWYFVVVVWIPLFFTLYLAPYIFPK
jgi:cytochrome c oxidase subunit III